MNFDERLQRAVQRGQRMASEMAQAHAEQMMSERQFKSIHTNYQLQLSDHIESCLNRLPDHFPGFEYSTVVDDRGWGGTVSRDDLKLSAGHRDRAFSHMGVFIRPFADVHILNLVGKATIRNKEIFNRSFYEPLADVDLQAFRDTVDHWVLEFAERYAAS